MQAEIGPWCQRRLISCINTHQLKTLNSNFLIQLPIHFYLFFNGLADLTLLGLSWTVIALSGFEEELALLCEKENSAG